MMDHRQAAVYEAVEMQTTVKEAIGSRLTQRR
jgi:hypothetical protein